MPGQEVPPWAARSLQPDSGGFGPREVGCAVGADEVIRENEGKEGEIGKERREKEGKGMKNPSEHQDCGKPPGTGRVSEEWCNAQEEGNCRRASRGPTMVLLFKRFL